MSDKLSYEGQEWLEGVIRSFAVDPEILMSRSQDEIKVELEAMGEDVEAFSLEIEHLVQKEAFVNEVLTPVVASNVIMSEVSRTTQTPEGTTSQSALSSGTILNNRFRIRHVLGMGGFGITYLAGDINLNTLVAIKEFLPRMLVGRASNDKYVTARSPSDARSFHHGMDRFLDEARTLEEFRHPNIARAHTYFKDNGTAYLVMDYYEGLDLQEYLNQMGGRLPEQTAIRLINCVLDGLREVHRKGFLHRDIKPQNVYLAKTDEGNVQPILIDFGAAREALGERSLLAMVTSGYAPMEQYSRSGQQGPWTDIYAVGATLYRMVTGQKPIDSMDRVVKDDLEPPLEVSLSLREAIMTAMAVKARDRFQSVEAFQNKLIPLIVQAPSSRSQAPNQQQGIDSPNQYKESRRKEVDEATGKPVGSEFKDRKAVSLGKRTKLVKINTLVAFMLGLSVLGVLIIALGSLNVFETRTTVSGLDGLRVWRNSIDMELIRVSAGTFEMGYNQNRPDEKSVHSVTINSPFYLSKYEVTQKQWFDVMGTRPWQDEAYVREGDDYPAMSVSWEDAQEFLRRLNEREGVESYRLPTEAEWEYAARAGGTLEFSEGKLGKYAWFDQNTLDAGEPFVHRTGQKEPNAWGLHDMHGNVWEWVADWYGEKHHAQGMNQVVVDPKGPESGSTRVIRGGSIRDNELGILRRDHEEPDAKMTLQGFRVARDPT